LIEVLCLPEQVLTRSFCHRYIESDISGDEGAEASDVSEDDEAASDPGEEDEENGELDDEMGYQKSRDSHVIQPLLQRNAPKHKPQHLK
jgi:hypothetical protein